MLVLNNIFVYESYAFDRFCKINYKISYWVLFTESQSFSQRSIMWKIGYRSMNQIFWDKHLLITQ